MVNTLLALFWSLINGTCGDLGSRFGREPVLDSDDNGESHDPAQNYRKYNTPLDHIPSVGFLDNTDNFSVL